jgi:hypothetical protein
MNLIELSEAIHKQYAGWKQIDIITGNWVYIGDRLYKWVSTNSMQRLYRLIDRGKRVGQVCQPLLIPTYFWRVNPKVQKKASVEEVSANSPIQDNQGLIRITR